MGRKSQCEIHHEEILRLNLDGLTRRQISLRLDLPFHTIQAYLQRRGIAPAVQNKGNPKRIDPTMLQRLLDDGLTQSSIAERLEVHLTTIERSVGRLGLRTARTGPRAAEQHHQRWAGGRHLDKHGYILIFVPLHPGARTSGYVYEHRLLMEVTLGRYLLREEVPHHLDDHPRHNWPSNLELHPDNASHLHRELTGREKASRRVSIPGAYRSTKKILRCPDARETLAQCPAKILRKLERHIEIHRPTNEHQSLPRRSFLRSGALQKPFE